MDQNVNVEMPVANKPKSKMPLIIGLVVVVAAIAAAIVLVPKLTKGDTDEKKSPKEEEKKIEVDYESMATQVEEEMAKYFDYNFSKYNGGNNEFYFKVDRDSIKYTSDYSSTGEKYYVMEAISYNYATNLKVEKYFARCKWDEKTGKITDYKDTTILSMLLGGLENSLYDLKLSGYFAVRKDELKNDSLWNHREVDKEFNSTFLYNVSLLDFYCFDYEASKNNSNFEAFKKKYIDSFKLIKIGKVKLHMAQVVTDSDWAQVYTVIDYIDSSLKYGNEEKIAKLDEAIQNAELHYEEIVEGKK